MSTSARKGTNPILSIKHDVFQSHALVNSCINDYSESSDGDCVTFIKLRYIPSRLTFRVKSKIRVRDRFRVDFRVRSEARARFRVMARNRVRV